MATRVSYKSNLEGATEDIHRQASTAIRLMLEDVLRFAAPNTPKKLGNLSKDVLRTVVGLIGTIEWRKGYAAPQEVGTIRGRKIKNYTTPGTGPHYAKNAVTQVNGKVSDYFTRAKI